MCSFCIHAALQKVPLKPENERRRDDRQEENVERGAGDIEKRTGRSHVSRVVWSCCLH